MRPTLPDVQSRWGWGAGGGCGGCALVGGLLLCWMAVVHDVVRRGTWAVGACWTECDAWACLPGSTQSRASAQRCVLPDSIHCPPTSLAPLVTPSPALPPPSLPSQVVHHPQQQQGPAPAARPPGLQQRSTIQRPLGGCRPRPGLAAPAPCPGGCEGAAAAASTASAAAGPGAGPAGCPPDSAGSAQARRHARGPAAEAGHRSPARCQPPGSHRPSRAAAGRRAGCSRALGPRRGRLQQLPPGLWPPERGPLRAVAPGIRERPSLPSQPQPAVHSRLPGPVGTHPAHAGLRHAHEGAAPEWSSSSGLSGGGGSQQQQSRRRARCRRGRGP